MTMREECGAAGRHDSIDPGGDTSTQRADPRAGGQEVMFLVTLLDTCPALDHVQISRANNSLSHLGLSEVSFLSFIS